MEFDNDIRLEWIQDNEEEEDLQEKWLTIEEE